MVNLCQKLLFLHQLTHNMTADCSLNCKFNTWKFQAQTWGEHVVYRNCFWHWNLLNVLLHDYKEYDLCYKKKKKYDISSRGEITSKKSSSFLRGPRVPIMLIILTFRTIFVHNLFSPCSTKRRVSDKDLPVIPTKLFDFISNNCVSETSKVNTSSIHTLCLRVLWVEDPA